MRLSDLRKHYRVTHWEDNKYFVYNKEEGSGDRMVFKYLCSIEKVSSTKFKVSDRSLETSKVNDIISEIEASVASLKYDSEYYYPMYRPGLFEEFIVRDYLSDIGFKSRCGYGNSVVFTLKHKNIYGDYRQDITLSIDFQKDVMSIVLHCGQFSWVESTCDRKVELIKDAINSLIKPLLVTESAYNLKKCQKVEDIKDFKDLTLNQLAGFDVMTADFKVELKEQLTKILETL